jgi:hypothetical protein
MEQKNRTGKSFAATKNLKRQSQDLIGWIAFLDIFGFSSHSESSFFSDSEKKLLEMHKMLNLDPLFCGDGSYFMFSDSIVLWTGNGLTNEVGLRRFIERIVVAQKVAADRGFLLRGSLAHGRILVSSNYILGDAYLRAYRFEAQRLVEPIVVIPKSEIEAAGQLDVFETDLEDITLKQGNTEKVIILNYVPWEQQRDIRRANIAAIMSSTLSSDDKTRLVARWKTGEEG